LYEKSETEKWIVLADNLVKVPELTNENFIHEVVDFAENHLNKEKLAISAASKLLWFRHQWPVKIYDSRAVNALRALGFRPGAREYKTFCAAWTRAFEHYKADLLAAVTRVNKDKDCTLIPLAEQKDFMEFGITPSFLERAFDQYLWLLGDPQDESYSELAEG
jgi:hypothetical protein